MPKNYLVLVSEDPLDSLSMHRTTDLALQLKRRGHTVAMFLLQNGVLAARAQSAADPLARVLAGAVEISADEFSLRERGIEANGLRDGVKMAPIDLVVQRLAAGWTTLWS